MNPISPKARQADKMAEITDILNMLNERTQQDKVRWRATAAAEAFTAVLGSFSVVIEHDRLNDNVLRVLDKSGNEIDRLDKFNPKGGSWRAELSELYATARRVALGVDSQLDELLKELESAD